MSKVGSDYVSHTEDIKSPSKTADITAIRVWLCAASPVDPAWSVALAVWRRDRGRPGCGPRLPCVPSPATPRACRGRSSLLLVVCLEGPDGPGPLCCSYTQKGGGTQCSKICPYSNFSTIWSGAAATAHSVPVASPLQECSAHVFARNVLQQAAADRIPARTESEVHLLPARQGKPERGTSLCAVRTCCKMALALPNCRSLCRGQSGTGQYAGGRGGLTL
jgi:hypothetical protein